MWEAEDRDSTGALEEGLGKFRRWYGNWEMQEDKEVAKKFYIP